MHKYCLEMYKFNAYQCQTVEAVFIFGKINVNVVSSKDFCC